MADRIDGTAGSVGTLLMGRLAFLFLNVARFEVQILRVTRIFQNQRLGAVANDHPLACIDFHAHHPAPVDASEAPMELGPHPEETRKAAL